MHSKCRNVGFYTDIVFSVSSFSLHFKMTEPPPASTELLSYLRLDAQKVFPLQSPKLELHNRTWVVSPEQHHARVFF